MSKDTTLSPENCHKLLHNLYEAAGIGALCVVPAYCSKEDRTTTVLAVHAINEEGQQVMHVVAEIIQGDTYFVPAPVFTGTVQ